jgi:hypothetical protein
MALLNGAGVLFRVAANSLLSTTYYYFFLILTFPFGKFYKITPSKITRSCSYAREFREWKSGKVEGLKRKIKSGKVEKWKG